MPTKLFVGGIPYRATDEELRQLFSQAGEVSSVFIPMDRETNRPRGFAFVEMADDAAADKAISMFDGSDGRSPHRGQQSPSDEERALAGVASKTCLFKRAPVIRRAFSYSIVFSHP